MCIGGEGQVVILEDIRDVVSAGGVENLLYLGVAAVGEGDGAGADGWVESRDDAAVGAVDVHSAGLCRLQHCRNLQAAGGQF